MSKQAISISLRYSEPLFADQAKKLADHLQIPFASNKKPTHYILQLGANGLELINTQANSTGPIWLDFVGGKNAYRQRHGGGKNQTISRAVGLHKEKALSIIDATAGMGQDSFVFASLGADVTLLERSPIVAALLKDALTRAAMHEEAHEVTKNMRLIETDAKTYLVRLEQQSYPDVIYLDPMYPERNKSALTKKEMRITRDIVGNDHDIDELFIQSLQRCKKRVVVKRPKRAPLLNNTEATMQIESKNTRYDVYVIKALKEFK